MTSSREKVDCWQENIEHSFVDGQGFSSAKNRGEKWLLSLTSAVLLTTASPSTTAATTTAASPRLSSTASAPPPRTRFKIAREIYDGLLYMHSQNMIHGGIKSLNTLCLAGARLLNSVTLGSQPIYVEQIGSVFGCLLMAVWGFPHDAAAAAARL